MILLRSLFHLQDLHVTPDEMNAILKVNAQHPILEGHFPGFPVMPGVCMLQVVREVFEVGKTTRVRISAGDTIKFLTVLEPSRHEAVKLRIQYRVVEEGFDISASITSVDTGDTIPVTFFKFKGIYT